MAVVTQVSAESVVGGLVKPKRVRKGVLKADNSDNSPKILDKALIIPKTLKTPLNKENSQSNILNIASTIPEKVAIKVKISKQRSKKGENTPIIEQNMPTNPKTDPILVTTAPNNGINEMPFVKNSHADVFVNSIIPNSTLVEQALINVLKKAVGRPRGSLDKVKREAKGDHKLGRPLGSKDRRPRQQRTTPQMS